MNFHAQWNPLVTMVVVNFGLATVNALLKKILDKGLNRLVIVAYRQSISAMFVTPIAYFWESALIGITLSQYLLLLGLDYTSATFACAFINMVPVGTFLLALPFGMEKVNMKNLSGRAKVLGTIVSLGGAMLLTFYKGKPLTDSHLGVTNHAINHAHTIVSTKKAKNRAIGLIFLIAGCIVWSSWFLMQERISKRYPCQYSSTAIMSSFGGIQSAIMSFIIERNLPGWVLKGKLEIIAVTYAGIVGSGLCYVGMSWCVKQRGPSFTSAFTPLIQIFIVMIDFSILHEPIYLGSVLGSILVMIGLYVLLWGKSKGIEECDPMKHPRGAQQDEQQCNNAITIDVDSNNY